MTPFLAQVAAAYLEHEAGRLIDYCFVLPNKRAATYLSRHFAELSDKQGGAMVQPAITTISDLVVDNSPWVEASRMELLFMLYNVYRRVILETYGDIGSLDSEQRQRMADSIDFDKFQYWGEVLISDFNDVDKYMVDAGELFHNVESLKEISSNFLTDEQMDVVSRYWNEDRLPDRSDEFWRHTSRSRLSTKFVKLWQVLWPVYDSLRHELMAEGMCYPGMAYRQLADDIKTSHGDMMRYDRYIFVGFNVLSTSERRIFELLAQFGKADFYWDYQSPTFAWKGNRATRFLERYVNEFKSTYPVGDKLLDSFPQIDIISVPSTVGQPKVAGEILAKLYPTRGSAPFNRDPDDKSNTPVSALETAIVLPDEHLAIPMLHSLPLSIATVNVTMGYPLRNTPVASLVAKVISLQMRARKLRSRDTFYYEDVINVLTHPLVIRRHGALCAQLIDEITRRNMFNISTSYLSSARWQPLMALFEIVDNMNDRDAVFDYLARLLTFIEDSMSSQADDGLNEVDLADSAVSMTLQKAFVQRYRAGLATLRDLAGKYLSADNVVMADKTVFHMAQRMMSGESVPLEGMPLEGLQIMGVLETRGLDFENIIMPSMNERIFPRKHYQRSFIPNALRRGYGMATLDHQESIFAYYFYRLITRAKRLYLLYDGRSSGTRNGQCSRYISQLQYLFNIPGIRHYVATFGYTPPTDEQPMSVTRTERLNDIIRRYLPGAENPKYLSASSINKLIECPLKFCLSELEGLGEPDSVKDYIDEGTLGSIVHAVLESMYNDAKGGASEVLITSDTIKRMSNEAVIYRYITRAVNEIFNRLGINNDTPLSAEASLIADVIQRMVKALLAKEPVPFTYMESEWRRSGVLKISDSLSVNFTQSIDRIDRVQLEDGRETLRVVDYKTGGDKPSMKSWQSAFDQDKRDRPKVMIQLFLYCNGYAQLNDRGPYTGPIKPQMYRLRSIVKGDHADCRIDKIPILNYQDYNEEFMSELEKVLGTLFDFEANEPFVAAATDHPCKYCQFAALCNRNK